MIVCNHAQWVAALENIEKYYRGTSLPMPMTVSFHLIEQISVEYPTYLYFYHISKAVVCLKDTSHVLEERWTVSRNVACH